jgi:hypothetical protein
VVTRALCDIATDINTTLKFNVGRGTHSENEGVLRAAVAEVIQNVTGQLPDDAQNPGYLEFRSVV